MEEAWVLRYAKDISQARRAWLEPRNVLNTLPLDEFLGAVTSKG
jgi:hypothetical protein